MIIKIFSKRMKNKISQEPYQDTYLNYIIILNLEKLMFKKYNRKLNSLL